MTRPRKGEGNALRGAMIAVAFIALAGATVAAPKTGAMFRGVPKSALIAAAKAAPLRLIDYLESYCDGDEPIGRWLGELTASQAASVSWTAGDCELVNNLNPLDEGGRFCVQATIRLKHPKNRQDRPEIEVYLEDPKHGRPGKVYAFRDMFDAGDGLDYERERRAFEDQWRDRFKDAAPRRCEDQ